jgi:hypothetical protein
MIERPLTMIMQAIRKSESIPLVWVVRWSEGDVDPLAAAWKYSADRHQEQLARVVITDYTAYAPLPKGICKWAASWELAYLSSKATNIRILQFDSALTKIDRNPPTIQVLLAAMQERR